MKRHFRTLWLSDIHLGCKDCKAEYLLDFLRNHTFDTLYLVGDIVDMWAMSRQFMWPAAHNELFHMIVSLPNKGVRVVYLPGNHDAPAQKYDGMNFVDIEIRRECVHTFADGRKFLILHGDQFDDEVCFGKIHHWIGDKAYVLLLFLNRWYNRVRSMFGYKYWSFAGYIKERVKGAVEAVERFKACCCQRAREMELDGVICGHIHNPEIDECFGVQYCNNGDWIENCSALTEDQNGELKLVFWQSVSNTHVKAIENIPAEASSDVVAGKSREAA